LRQQKADFGLQQAIKKTDIMFLLTLSWAESFTIVENNKNACAAWGWGWNPLNYALMEHEDLEEGAKTEVQCVVSHATILAFNSGTALVDPATLNMKEGFSQTIVNIMVDTSLKRDKTQE
jgi:hypothetical protein